MTSSSPPPISTLNTTLPIEPPSATTVTADIIAQHLQSPAQILEKSQKTLECIQKTVTEATDEINRTIGENLIDLKSLENEIKATGVDQLAPQAPLEKQTSSRSLAKISSDSNVMAADSAMMANKKSNDVEAVGNIETTNGSPSDSFKKLQTRKSNENIPSNEHGITAVHDENIDSQGIVEQDIGIDQELSSHKGFA